MTETVLTVVLAMLGVLLALVLVTVLVLTCLGIYYVWGLNRVQKMEQAIEDLAVEPKPERMDEGEVTAMLDRARGNDDRLKQAWAAEKMAENWTEEDIDEFLDHRPEIELN